MQMYEVGGCVRDEILGVPSKDIDFTVVLEDGDMENWFKLGIGDPFRAMALELSVVQGFKIFLETPEYLTIRASFPKDHPVYPRKAADFVLARKESGYADGRRPDVVEPGTLFDDLSRRDFTMNAIAKVTTDSAGTHYIDPYDGQGDIQRKIIRAVGDPRDRLYDDALRAVRALRFAVTKGFTIAPDLKDAMFEPVILKRIEDKISDERIQVELSKMFRFDTPASIRILGEYGPLTAAMFSGTVSLDATMKTRGRG